jgi:tRNA (guanine-N7-)-methyltransferase
MTEPRPLSDPAKDAKPLDEVAHPRRIRSFVRRAGRMTTGQERAVAQLGPQLVIPFEHQVLDWNAAFGPSLVNAPCVLEIGFGMGEATAQIASVLPQTRFLCCEVHEPGVGALLMRIQNQGLANIRIMAHDAVEVMTHMLAPASLDGLHLFFPDPWHKKRHHKRRLVQPEWLAAVCTLIKPGGYVHFATDWQPYAAHMLEVLQSQPSLRNRSPHASGYADRPHYRPETKFERRGLRLGHGVWDLVFERLDGHPHG